MVPGRLCLCVFLIDTSGNVIFFFFFFNRSCIGKIFLPETITVRNKSYFDCIISTYQHSTDIYFKFHFGVYHILSFTTQRFVF